MRITFVLPSRSLSGGVRVVATYAQKLQERGHEVVIVTRVRTPLLRNRIRNIFRAERSNYTVRGPSHLDGLQGIDQREIRTAGPIRERDIPDGDVIIATWWETAEWVAPLSLRKGAKVYFVQHDEQVWYGSDRKEMKDRAAATWKLPMRKIVVSHWLERLVIERDPLASVSCIPNSVDLEAFSCPNRSKQEIPTVGFMYSEPLFKGTDIVLRAIEKARLTIPDLRVVGFGMSSPTRSMPLPKGCHYVKCPPQTEIPNIYATCDVWLVLSRFEGFGLPLLEAMACRTPVIASSAGAAPEVLAGGGGILVPTEDYLRAAEAIVRFANLRDDEWKIISETAFSTVTQYTWNDAAALFEAALGRALEPESKEQKLSSSKF